MWNLRPRSCQKKQGVSASGRSLRNDFISQMPDELLLMILCRLSTKDAVATSSLSTRWRFLWRSLNVFDFDGDETLRNMEADNLINEQTEFINKFALDKKVEILELDLMDKSYIDRENPDENYDLPLPLSSGRMIHFYKWPSPNDIVLEMVSLRRLELYGVSVTEPTLKGFLKGAPHLEWLSIYGSHLSTHIHVGGRDINLKHFKVVGCSGVEFISLYDFDIVSFTQIGAQIEYHLTDLPKLEELRFWYVSLGLEDNVFSQISSCVSYLHVLYMDIRNYPEEINFNAIPKLPNVKKLTLIIRATQDDSLLDYTSIAKACPILETFEITLYWFTLVKRRRKVRRAASHRHEHLKLLKIEGYYGRMSDLELVVYG